MFGCRRFACDPGQVDKDASTTPQINQNPLNKKEMEGNMSEPKPALPRNPRELPKSLAIAFMSIGFILTIQVAFLQSEPGSSAQVGRIVLAAIGLVLLLVGAIKRPIKVKPEKE